MSDQEPLTVDDLVSAKAAEQLGEGVIPVKAILIVETMTEDGGELRYVLSQGIPRWHAIGMLRSSQLRLESIDTASWQGDDEDLD